MAFNFSTWDPLSLRFKGFRSPFDFVKVLWFHFTFRCWRNSERIRSRSQVIEDHRYMKIINVWNLYLRFKPGKTGYSLYFLDYKFLFLFKLIIFSTCRFYQAQIIHCNEEAGSLIFNKEENLEWSLCSCLLSQKRSSKWKYN